MQRALPRFQREGLAVAAMSYDSPAILREFSKTYHITYPLLSDPHSETIRSFALIDPDNGPENRPDYAKTDMAYPGYFWIGRDGVVKERFIGNRYFERFTANHVIGRMFPELVEFNSGARAPYLSVRSGQSDDDVITGSRLSLNVDLLIPRGTHVYGPTAKGVQGLSLEIPPTNVRIRGIDYGIPGATIKLPETVGDLPVYTGTAHIRADVIVIPSPEIQKQLQSENHDLRLPANISATLRYQACTAKLCYRPTELPVLWTVHVHPLNDDRAPEAIRDRPGAHK